MTEIIDGVLRYNELTKNANGGTELMARRMANTINPELMQGVQIIHSRVRQLEPGYKRILVLHDLATDPEVEQLKDPAYRANFDKLVFVSNWQQQMYNIYLGIPFSEGAVMNNAIEIDPTPATKSVDGPIKLIYHTTPHRDLAILAPVFEALSKQFDIELDVFSLFEAYGWGERDRHFAELFAHLDSMPNVRNHGFQPNAIVRQYLNDAHIFAYPNTWQETSCIALIEAMASGVMSVHSNLGALPETSGGLTQMYGFQEDANRHANEFYSHLGFLLDHFSKNREAISRYSAFTDSFAAARFDWQKIKSNGWEPLLMKVKQ